MELREWLPLVISGVLGLAGIIAGLWGTLANVRVQRERDKRDAAAREAAAEREAETAQRAHLLDERRAAYTDFVHVAFPWLARLQRRLHGDDSERVRPEDPMWNDTEQALGAVDLVASEDVSRFAHRLYGRLVVAEAELHAARVAGLDWHERIINDAQDKYRLMLRAMNTDLKGES